MWAFLTREETYQAGTEGVDTAQSMMLRVEQLLGTMEAQTREDEARTLERADRLHEEDQQYKKMAASMRSPAMLNRLGGLSSPYGSGGARGSLYGRSPSPAGRQMSGYSLANVQAKAAFLQARAESIENRLQERASISSPSGVVSPQQVQQPLVMSGLNEGAPDDDDDEDEAPIDVTHVAGEEEEAKTQDDE